MAPIAQRVAFRFKVADLTEDPPSELKSLDNLVKKNGGLFKSPKQGAFLWHWAKDHDHAIRRDMHLYSGGKFNGGVIDHWGAPYAKGENAFTGISVMRLKQGGRKDVKKMRFFGYAFVVDGAGVAAYGKLKFHYEYDETKEPGVQFWPDGVETTFVRQADAAEVFNNAQAERERATRVEANREMIDKLKSLDAFQDENNSGFQIINSFVRQLEQGKPLSVAQKGILRKFMEGVSLGDDNEWVTRRDSMIAETEVKVIKPYLKGIEHGIQEVKHLVPHPSNEKDKENILNHAEGLHAEIKAQWLAFKKKPTKQLAIMSQLYQVAQGVIQHAHFPKTQTAGLFAILMAADQMARAGQKAPATALKLNWAIDKAKGWLDSANAHSVEEVAKESIVAHARSLTEPSQFARFH